MDRPTEPLRAEHRELLPHVAHLAETADLVGERPASELRSALDEDLDFLQNHLIPHAMAEDVALYPEVDRAIGSTVPGSHGATATMRRDHVEVVRLTEELAAAARNLAAGGGGGVDLAAAERRVRRLLYGLHALVSVHFAKEEEVYLPLLDRTLTPEAAHELFERMEEAARAAKA